MSKSGDSAGTVPETDPSRCSHINTPDVPDDVPWSDYRWYNCQACRWPCIERIDSAAGKAGVCWYCLREESVDYLVNL